MDWKKCPHCPEVFAEKKQRKQHIDIYHQNPLHNCDLCGKRFKMAAALNMHKQQMHRELMHSDWLPDDDEFQPISNGDTMIIDGLSEVDFLSYVPAAAVATPTFACQICGTGFSSKRAMYEHNKGKHEKRLFLCPCGMSFKWRPALNNHSKKCSVVAAAMISFQSLCNSVTIDTITLKYFRAGYRAQIYIH